MLTPSTFTEILTAGPLAIDGGMSTQLESMGCAIGGELWTAQTLLDDPTDIENAHRAYVEAGAKVVITASYQISRASFTEVGLTPEQADRAIVSSIEAAKRAVAGTDALVAASVGPYGAILHDGSEYRGDYGVSVADLTTFHVERLAVIANTDADLVAMETIPDAKEAQALVAALAEFPSVVGWMSFTIGPDGKLWAGQTLAEAVAIAVTSPSLVAVGINCVDPALVDAAIAEIRTVTDLPIVIYANGGGVWNSDAGVWENADAHSLAELAPSWAAQGASLIGGCCGTHAGDIHQLTQVL